MDLLIVAALVGGFAFGWIMFEVCYDAIQRRRYKRLIDGDDRDAQVRREDEVRKRDERLRFERQQYDKIVQRTLKDHGCN